MPVTAQPGGSAEGAAQHGVRLGAALFNGDHGRLAEELGRLEAAGLDFVHLDVFDGYFVSDVGFAPRTIAALRKVSRLPFEVHLGVAEPLRFAPALADAGVDLILFHIESTRMAYETVFSIRSLKVKAGLALSLGTSLEFLEPLICVVDAVLLLSRVTGEGTKGASFDASALPRIRTVREMCATACAQCDVQAAGGLNRTNAGSVAAAGARSLALGSGIYKVPDMGVEVAAVRAIAEGAAAGGALHA
jgi:ribulose-phosphate 3-epimerase